MFYTINTIIIVMRKQYHDICKINYVSLFIANCFILSRVYVSDIWYSAVMQEWQHSSGPLRPPNHNNHLMLTSCEADSDKIP